MVNSRGLRLVLEDQGVDDLVNVAREIRDISGERRVWLLSGDLGAGKTTLLKAIARIFGIEDPVSSPTFSLVNEYRNDKDEVFFHFDFYRIEDIQEVVDIGFDEYLESGAYCFIEWPEVIEALLPDEFVLVRIQEHPSGLRRFEIDIYE